ncbi:hypothetical protein EJ08DRAFT_655660 [Tothia fuscella]|uniref:Uncharacterized protein n=1 Tax=Tothia fuscella TaxID=1048955 RepID=A0A9P4P4F2_9PEZI|nr:hypothetical protein EJ08DRAFT_655660 [Tothia fuscella]
MSQPDFSSNHSTTDGKKVRMANMYPAFKAEDIVFTTPTKSTTKTSSISLWETTPVNFFSPEARSQSHFNTANVGRKRMYSPSTLFSSPARAGHTSRMASIFRNAATSIKGSPTRAMRQEASADSEATLVTAPCESEIGEKKYGEVLYPKLGSDTNMSPLPCEENSFSVVPKTGTPDKSPFYLSPGPQPGVEPHSVETIRPSPQYKDLGRPGPLHFRVDSAIEDEEGSANLEEDGSSTSSASWTGDSQFFHRSPPKREVLPVHVRECSVTRWLDRLPSEMPLPASESDSDEPLAPLSPSVELSRGSMRRRQREWDRLERGERDDDADSFV